MTAYVFKRVKDYYKYEYQDWTQPVLTANGTMGGNSFAASQVGFADEGDLKAFRAFDNNTSTMCYFAKSTGYLQWYNPNPLKITNLRLTNFTGDAWGTRALTAGSIQVSNDGSSFVELKTFTNNATGGGASWNIDLSNNTGYYKYYRIVCTGNSVARPEADAQCHIAELKITATEQTTVKGSVDDYDFRTSKAYVLKRKQYWKWEGSESTELAYACYKSNNTDTFVYLKTPIGKDSAAYSKGTSGVSFGQIATSPAELDKLLYVIGISATESNANITTNFPSLGTATYPTTRYTAGDLYETVSTKVAVPATKDDYDFTTDKAYVLRRK